VAKNSAKQLAELRMPMLTKDRSGGNGALEIFYKKAILGALWP
jgi:hypothetical protein